MQQNRITAAEVRKFPVANLGRSVAASTEVQHVKARVEPIEAIGIITNAEDQHIAVAVVVVAVTYLDALMTLTAPERIIAQ